jgi:hypothetical protein
VRPRAAAVVQHVGVVASGFFERIGQDRQAVEGTIGVYAGRERDGRFGSPRWGRTNFSVRSRDVTKQGEVSSSGGFIRKQWRFTRCDFNIERGGPAHVLRCRGLHRPKHSLESATGRGVTNCSQLLPMTAKGRFRFSSVGEQFHCVERIRDHLLVFPGLQHSATRRHEQPLLPGGLCHHESEQVVGRVLQPLLFRHRLSSGVEPHPPAPSPCMERGCSTCHRC